MLARNEDRRARGTSQEGLTLQGVSFICPFNYLSNLLPDRLTC